MNAGLAKKYGLNLCNIAISIYEKFNLFTKMLKILYIVAFCFLYYNNVMQESKAENCETIINID